MQNELIFTQGQLSTLDFRRNLLCCLFDATKITDLQCPFLALKYLHPFEKSVLKQRKKNLAQKEYIASRFIIKNIIAQWHGCAFKKLFVCFDSKTNLLKVYLGQQCLPYQVSLSHSKGQVLVVVTRINTDIGVDLEYIDTKRQTRNLANCFFHLNEQKFLAVNDDSAFYKLWTLKEASAKMRRLSVMSVLCEDMTSIPDTFYYSTGTYQNYATAIVSLNSLGKITVYILTLEEFIQDDD